MKPHAHALVCDGEIADSRNLGKTIIQKLYYYEKPTIYFNIPL